MFLPNQPKGQIKMCCTHSLSVCLIFLETKAQCKCSIFFFFSFFLCLRFLLLGKVLRAQSSLSHIYLQNTRTHMNMFGIFESVRTNLPNLGRKTKSPEILRPIIYTCKSGSKQYQEETNKQKNNADLHFQEEMMEKVRLLGQSSNTHTHTAYYFASLPPL